MSFVIYKAAWPWRRGVQPSDIALVESNSALTIVWPDGTASRLEAGVLRRASRAASEIRRLADGTELVVAPDLRVEAVEPVGNYALRLFFSDGHDRGIYPWAYLRELAGLKAA
jgi:DUF971 family protein